MPTAKNNDLSIVYETHGDPAGVPLLAVMGLGGQLTDWPQGFIDELVGEGFWVIAPDNRDQGLSSEVAFDPPKPFDFAKSLFLRRPLPHAYLLSDMAGDMVAVLDDAGVTSAHVMGMSMGGMIAQEVAIRHPERVRSLTSIMSTTGNPKVGRPKLRTAIQMLRNRGDVSRDQALETSVKGFRQIAGPMFDESEFRTRTKASIERSYRPAGTSRQLAAILSSDDRTAGLHGVATPTVVIHGAVDPLVQPSGGIATAAAVPGSKLVMFPDMGHDLPANRWHEIAEATRQIAAKAGD